MTAHAKTARIVTASMLHDMTSCTHRAHLDLDADPALADEVSAFVRMLWDQGIAHETEVLADLPPRSVDLRDLAPGERRAATEAAMDAGADLIVGGEIAWGDLLARPDLIRRGDAGYVPGDIKAGGALDGATGRPKRAYAMQIALEVDILERSGRLAVRKGFILDGHARETVYDFDAPLGPRMPGTLWDAYLAMLVEARSIAAGRGGTTAAASAACKLCRWRSHCAAELLAADDVTLVPQLGRSVRAALAPLVTTVNEMADIDVAAATTQNGKTIFAGVGSQRLARFRDRARLVREPALGPRARRHLPLSRAPVEMFLDIEVDPFGSRTYLHGIVTRRQSPIGDLEDFAAHFTGDDSLEAERDAFAASLAQLTAEPGARVYVWSGYERTMYRALQARHPDVCEAEQIEALFASPDTIDLLSDIVVPMTDWPTHDHSIKTIAKWLGFSWRDREPSGAASIEWYRRYLATGDDAVRQRIVDYNEDDCVAEMVILDALLNLPVIPPEGGS